MIVDGLTKALDKQMFIRFVDILGLNDQRGRLETIRHQEDLKKLLVQRRQQEGQHTVAFAREKDLKAVL